MRYRSLFIRALLGICLWWASATAVQAQDPMKGQAQFLEKCASCHANNMKSKLTGPALANTEANWSAYPKEDLYKWIRNSQAMIAEGHPRAVQVWEEFKPTIMTSFPSLTDGDIEDILLYIKNMATTGTADGSAPAAAVAATGAGGQAEESGPNYLLWVLFGVLLLGVLFLARYVSDLNRLAEAKKTGAPSEEKSILELLLSPTLIKILVFGLVLVGGYTTVNTAISLGRQQGYAPEQPIKFSHALHAGKHGIDCQYCHDGARRSKHGVIPAMNTCLNCHVAVKKGPNYGTAEILKIYASTGLDPRSGAPKYFGEGDSHEARLAAYAEWLEAMADESGDLKSNPGKVKMDIERQLEAIKPMIGKTVEWVRIHNLADHVYFNHAQHVTVGKVECQTCHGKVEEMEVVKQYAPLSMGWCINCHRQTNVKFSDNDYYAGSDYKAFEKYHKEIKEGKRSGVTVEDIGGLECQKCHY